VRIHLGAYNGAAKNEDNDILQNIGCFISNLAFPWGRLRDGRGNSATPTATGPFVRYEEKILKQREWEKSPGKKNERG